MAEIVIKLVNGELAGKTMQDINKAVRDANKELSKAAVGTDAWVKAHAKLEDAKKLQADLKTQIDGTSKASDALKSAFGGVLSQIPGFGALGGFLSQAQGGVGGLTSGFGMLKGAIAATGFGLLLLLVAGLISAFSKFTPVIDKVEQILSGISAVVSELTQRLQTLGSGLWDIITNTPGGVDKLKSSFDGLGESITEAYNAGVELKMLQQDLDDLNRGIAISNAKQEAQVDRLILASKNQSAAIRERMALLQQARVIAEDNFAANDELDKKNLEALIREAQMNSKLNEDQILALAEGTLAQEEEYAKRGTISDELLQKITDAQVKVIQNEGENNLLLQKIINQESKIREQAEAERKKAADEEKKRQEELRKAEEERIKALAAAYRNYEDQKVQLIENARDRELVQIELATAREIEAIMESGILIAERTAAAQELARQKKDEVNKKWDAKELADNLARLDLELATEQNALNEKILARQITEQDFAMQSAQNVIDWEKKKLDLIRAAHGEESAQYQSAYAALLQHQREFSDATVAQQKKTADQMAQAVVGIASTFGGVFSTLASEYEQGTQQWKNFAIAAATMSAIQGAINAYTSAAAIPYVGTILAPIAAATALAAGFAQVKKIQNTKATPPAKKELGGPLYGPRHSQGGIPIEAEGGEFIFSRKATAAIGVDTLNRINNYHTRKFALGGPVNPFQDRPSVTRNGGGAPSFNSSPSQEKPAWVDDIIAAQDRRMDRIKVTNVVSETEEGIKTINQIKEEADV